MQATTLDGAEDDVSDLLTEVRYSNGNREYPEFIGTRSICGRTKTRTSSIHFAVRGRYGRHLGRLGTHIGTAMQAYRITACHAVP